MAANPPAPSARKQSQKGPGVVVWVVPVALVGVILIAIIVFFVMKSRRLERSMFALMTRRTVDDEGGVTFHSSGMMKCINFRHCLVYYGENVFGLGFYFQMLYPFKARKRDAFLAHGRQIQENGSSLLCDVISGFHSLAKQA